MNGEIAVGTLCWSTLQNGDERIYRVVRMFTSPQHPDAGLQAELETVYRADLTTPTPGFMVPITKAELQRRIAVLTNLASELG